MFGFTPSKYEIHESEGLITVNVFFIGNPGDYQAVVLISTHNGTATGQIFHIYLLNNINNKCSLEHIPRALSEL